MFAIPSWCTHTVPTPGRSPISLMTLAPVLVCSCNFRFVFQMFVKNSVFQNMCTVDWLSRSIQDLFNRHGPVLGVAKSTDSQKKIVRIFSLSTRAITRDRPLGASFYDEVFSFGTRPFNFLTKYSTSK